MLKGFCFNSPSLLCIMKTWLKNINKRVFLCKYNGLEIIEGNANSKKTYYNVINISLFVN